MLKPVFVKPDEVMQKKIDEKVKVIDDRVKADIDTKIKNEVDERVKAILKEREDADKKERADKLAKAVDVAKTLKAADVGGGEKEKAEREKAEKAEREKNDILCPTCHAGHLHKMEQSRNGLSIKCVGKDCGKEYVLLDTMADYRCQTCGIAIKRPEDPSTIDGCPFCGSTRAVKFDWSKIRKLNIKK